MNISGMFCTTSRRTQSQPWIDSGTSPSAVHDGFSRWSGWKPLRSIPHRMHHRQMLRVSLHAIRGNESHLKAFAESNGACTSPYLDLACGYDSPHRHNWRRGSPSSIRVPFWPLNRSEHTDGGNEQQSLFAIKMNTLTAVKCSQAVETIWTLDVCSCGFCAIRKQ